MPSLFKLNSQIPADSFQTVSLNLLAFQNVLQNHGPLATEGFVTDTEGVSREQSNAAENSLERCQFINIPFGEDTFSTIRTFPKNCAFCRNIKEPKTG